MRTELNRRSLLAGGAGLAVFPLASCAKAPGGFIPDPSTIDFAQLATVTAKNLCGLLPTADTLAKLALALALPAGLPVEQIAAAVAKAFCDNIAPIVAARAAAGRGRLKTEPSTGKAIIDYGTVILPNGRTVPVQVYAQ